MPDYKADSKDSLWIDLSFDTIHSENKAAESRHLIAI